MPCIKTGAHVYLEEYDEYAYGDMHLIAGNYVFRTVQVDRLHLRELLHYKIRMIAAFWRDVPVGTIIATAVVDYGYDGIALPPKEK